MWPYDRPTSYLDDIATDFLAAHGTAIAAEPRSQLIAWVGHKRMKTKPVYVPLAAFLDLPRISVCKNPSLWRECYECKARCVGTRCDRCSKRTVRTNFVAKWNLRSTDSQSLLDAILAQSAWEGPEGEPSRVVVAPVATEEEEEEASALKEAFAAAIDRNAEPEGYREILVSGGFADVIEARDERAAQVEARRQVGYYNKRLKESPHPVVHMDRVQAKNAAAVLVLNPRFHGGFRCNTGSHWKADDVRDLHILCAAGTALEKAADAIGRSPTSIVHQARRERLSLPPEWRVLLNPPRAAVIVPPRQQLAYPFIVRKRDDHAELLAVNRLVAQYLPGREDICQEIMLAMWEGKITLAQLQAKRDNIREFVRAFRRSNFEQGGAAMSLDAPIRRSHDGDDMYLKNVLSDDDYHARMAFLEREAEGDHDRVRTLAPFGRQPIQRPSKSENLVRERLQNIGLHHEAL